jgi:3-phenylpropionate/trans-cinnamate dioxygenase ferredoxin reductase subunit
MTTKADSLENVVIVGASAAGLSAADGLREGGYDGRVIILGDEQHEPYDRPTLSKKLLAAQGEPQLHALRTRERLEAADVTLLLGHRAVGLDVDRHYVVTENGDAVPWDAVIIATGSRPRTLVTTEAESLPVFRTPADLHVLRAAAARYGQVTLIGAGLIGLEIAASLSAHQVEVTLINNLELPLRNVLGAPVAEELRELHRRHGVDLFLGVTVESVSGGPGSYSVQLSNGSTHRTSFILVGIGVDANDEWLDGSGVALDAGVLVDAAGRANLPGVWAAGDVARLLSHPSLPESTRVEHWTHAIAHGRHVGLNVARGSGVPYASVPYFWTEQYGRRFHGYGRIRPDDTALVVEGALDDDEYLVLYGSGDEFHAAVSCGCVRSLRGYRKVLERNGSWRDALDLASHTDVVRDVALHTN